MSEEEREEKRELEAAGWEAEEREDGETIWRNPRDGHWYEQERAIYILKEGVDPGSFAD